MSNGQTMSVLTLGRLTTGFGAAGWVLLMVAFSSLFDPKEAVKSDRNPDFHKYLWAFPGYLGDRIFK